MYIRPAVIWAAIPACSSASVEPPPQFAPDPPLRLGDGLHGRAHDRALGGDLLHAQHLGGPMRSSTQVRVLGDSAAAASRSTGSPCPRTTNPTGTSMMTSGPALALVADPDDLAVAHVPDDAVCRRGAW